MQIPNILYRNEIAVIPPGLEDLFTRHSWD